MDNILHKVKKKIDDVTVSPEETVECPGCKTTQQKLKVLKNNMVCPDCGHHLRMSARTRIEFITDKNSFKELFDNLSSIDFLEFPKYKEKLETAQKNTGEKEAVVCGTARIGGIKCALFVMDPRFIMASMGSVVGEKITRTFEYAEKKRLPVVGFTASGGARMQEGVTSLMQMAKVSAAVKKHSQDRNLYITVLTDPTTGGVTASFAMQGDIILAEPKALVGFAGRRVVEQTIGKKLPDDFQSAEFLLKHGFVDAIVPRSEMVKTLSTLLKMHVKG